ncbi:MAG: hypothetical protein JO362_10765 [Streptomycetaceae bacterium]|nr:hypothetical protein [Streptomycetaceae bacterium]
MAGLLERLEQREEAARRRVEKLREQAARIAEQLADAEDALNRLVITRATVDEVLAEPEREPAHRRTWVVLVDCDNHQIELIQAEARRRGVPIHLVVDFVHVAEYVWRAAWCFYSSGEPEAERWVGIQLLGILSGRLEETLAEIHQRARTAKLTDEQVHGLTQCTRYLKAKKPFLDYAGALTAGWSIAAGIVEGACRHLIADRMDITGARWGLEDAEAVLTLRADHSNGDFQQY